MIRSEYFVEKKSHLYNHAEGSEKCSVWERIKDKIWFFWQHLKASSTPPPPPLPPPFYPHPARWRWLGDAGLAQRRRSSHSLRPVDPALSSPSQAPFKVLRSGWEPRPASSSTSTYKPNAKQKTPGTVFRSRSRLGEPSPGILLLSTGWI